MNLKKLLVSITGVAALLVGANTYALTAGQAYTISVEKVNSNGTVTTGSTSLGLSTTATADANGKISFSFTSSLPTSSSCNFLVVSIKDSSGTTVRDALAPCPASGGTVPLGVSGVTDKQTDALLSAFLVGATDDPIMAVFGFAIVRSGSMTALDIAAMADVCYQGLYNTGGFIDYLKATRGVTDAQLVTYRSNIIAQLGDADTGYTKLMKDAVDSTVASDSASNRGKAAGQVLKTLITAADGVFEKDYIMEAFNSMGAIAVPLMQGKVTAGTLSATGAAMVNAGIGGGISKLQADRGLEKYTAAMTLMGASGADLTQFNAAVSALRTAMETAFAQFEDVFAENDSGTNGSSATIDSDRSAMEGQMQTAFGAYMTAMAASDARITSMISGIQSVSGVAPDANFFKFVQNGGSPVNWPINMVVLAQWGTTIAQASGSLSYTQDTLAIPAALATFMGSCTNAAYAYNQSACTGSGGTWTAGRRNFASGGYVPSQYPYGHLMNIQQDLMIREFKRFEDQNSAGSSMSARETLEKNFTDGLGTLAGNITGTTNGATTFTTTQKKAIITLMQSPQF